MPRYRGGFQEVLVGRECELEGGLFGTALIVPASRLTGVRAGSQCIINDGLDRSRTTAAFGTAAQAVIDMLGAPQHVVSGIDGIADIVVAEDVAGTNNHENAKDLR